MWKEWLHIIVRIPHSLASRRSKQTGHVGISISEGEGEGEGFAELGGEGDGWTAGERGRPDWQEGEADEMDDVVNGEVNEEEEDDDE